MAKDESPGLVQLASALFASALVTALVVGAWTALRLGVSSYALGALTAAAAYAFPALLAAALVRLAWASLGEPRAVRPLLVALTLTGAAGFVFALAVGRVLRATTHHTGLAGMTFAVVSAVFVVATLPLALRLSSSMPTWKPAKQTFLLGAVVVGLTIMLTMALRRVHGAVAAGELGIAASTAADAAVLLLLSVVVSLVQLGRVRALAMIAPPLFVALVVMGVSITRSHPDVSAALVQRAGLAARCSAWMIQ